MTTILSPIGYAVPYVGIDAEGRLVQIHPNLIRFWETDVSQRVGGNVAASNADLQAQINSIQGGELTFQGWAVDMTVPDTAQPFFCDQQFPDVTQSDSQMCLSETTFQS